jgi:hypothetical protein
MSERTCCDCGTDISGMHGKAIRCPGCRVKKYPPSKALCRYRCGRPVDKGGLCKSCYWFDWKYGEGYALLTPEERFWREVNKDGPVPAEHPELGKCWVWTGGRSGGGYGTLPLKDGWTYAHKFAYELLCGPIPGKRSVIQMCGLKVCVNPAHLRAVAGQWSRRPLPVVAAHVTGEDMAYWAGIADGEGYFGIHPSKDPDGRFRSFEARFILHMTHKPTVEGFAEAFGLKAVPSPYQGNLSVLPIYEAVAYCTNAAALVTALLPRLRIKRPQAEILLRLENEKRDPGLRTKAGALHTRNMRDGRVISRRASSYAQEHLERWFGYYVEVRGLNRPGRAIDFGPAWPGQDDEGDAPW